jgi:hypothetical protein
VGGFILAIASIFFGLASMPWRLPILPKRIPDGTPKMHLVGFSFLQGFKCFDEVSDEFISSLRLNHYIIDVNLNVLHDMVLEATLDGS